MKHFEDSPSNITFLFKEISPTNQGPCYHCVRIFVRTVNIIEKQECNTNQYIKKIFLNAIYSTYDKSI